MSSRVILNLWLTCLCAILLIGCGGQSIAPEPTPTLSPDAIAGKAVFTRHCASCHLLSEDNVKVGPSLHGIGDRAERRVPEQNAETYILTSIMNPSAYMVEGFEDLMPKSLAKSMTGEEIDQVVAYLLTFKEEE